MTVDTNEVVKEIREGDKIAIKVYLRHGGNPNARNQLGWTLLHIAALEGQAEIAECLLDAGATINCCTTDMCTPLHRACTTGSLRTVEVLVKKGAYINAQDKNGNTPLHEAARGLHTEVARLLLERKADRKRINKKNQVFTDLIGQQLMPVVESGDTDTLVAWLDWGLNANTFGNLNWSLLHHASARAQINTASILLERGADVNSIDSNRSCPLHTACFYGHKRIAELLIARGANLNAQDQRGNTPLHSAIAGSHPDIINMLLEHGCSTDIPNKEGERFSHLVNEFLIEAIDKSRVSHVIALLKGRADPNTKDSFGYPVLCCAVLKGEILIIDALLEAGGDPNLCSEDTQKTALHYAAASGQLFAAKALLDKNASVTVRDRNGSTPLHEAAREGAEDLITVLCGRGAPINAQDFEGNTPLHVAARWGQTSTVEMFIEKGSTEEIRSKSGLIYSDLALMRAVRTEDAGQVMAGLAWGGNPNIQDSKGWTLLHHAVYKGALDVSTVLIENEANVNFVDKHGRTPLLLAAYRGNCEIMELLLNTGSDPNIQDSSGQTPLHWAAGEGSIAAVELLLQRGADRSLRNKNGSLYSDLLLKHLYMAVRHNDFQKVECLLKAGADQTAEVKGTGTTPREEAKRRKLYPILRKMVSMAPKRSKPTIVKDASVALEDVSRLFEDHEVDSSSSEDSSCEDDYDPDEDAYWRMHNAVIVLDAKDIIQEENKSFWEHWEEKPKVIPAKEFFKDEQPWWMKRTSSSSESDRSADEDSSSVDSEAEIIPTFEELKRSWGTVVPAKEFFREDECWWRDAVEDLDKIEAVPAKEFFRDDDRPWWQQESDNEEDNECEKWLSAKEVFKEDQSWWLEEKEDEEVNEKWVPAKEFFREDKAWWEDDSNSDDSTDASGNLSTRAVVTDEGISSGEEPEESVTDDWETANDSVLSATSTMFSVSEGSKVIPAAELFAEQPWWDVDDEDAENIESIEEEMSENLTESSEITEVIDMSICTEKDQESLRSRKLSSTESESSMNLVLDGFDDAFIFPKDNIADDIIASKDDLDYIEKNNCEENQIRNKVKTSRDKDEILKTIKPADSEVPQTAAIYTSASKESLQSESLSRFQTNVNILNTKYQDYSPTPESPDIDSRLELNITATIGELREISDVRVDVAKSLARDVARRNSDNSDDIQEAKNINRRTSNELHEIGGMTFATVNDRVEADITTANSDEMEVADVIQRKKNSEETEASPEIPILTLHRQVSVVDHKKETCDLEDETLDLEYDNFPTTENNHSSLKELARSEVTPHLMRNDWPQGNKIYEPTKNSSNEDLPLADEVFDYDLSDSLKNKSITQPTEHSERLFSDDMKELPEQLLQREEICRLHASVPVKNEERQGCNILGQLEINDFKKERQVSINKENVYDTTCTENIRVTSPDVPSVQSPNTDNTYPIAGSGKQTPASLIRNNMSVPSLHNETAAKQQKFLKYRDEKLVTLTLSKPAVNKMDACLAKVDASLAWLDARMANDYPNETGEDNQHMAPSAPVYQTSFPKAPCIPNRHQTYPRQPKTYLQSPEIITICKINVRVPENIVTKTRCTFPADKTIRLETAIKHYPDHQPKNSIRHSFQGKKCNGAKSEHIKHKMEVDNMSGTEDTLDNLVMELRNFNVSDSSDKSLDYSSKFEHKDSSEKTYNAKDEGGIVDTCAYKKWNENDNANLITQASEHGVFCLKAFPEVSPDHNFQITPHTDSTDGILHGVENPPIPNSKNELAESTTDVISVMILDKLNEDNRLSENENISSNSAANTETETQISSKVLDIGKVENVIHTSVNTPNISLNTSENKEQSTRLHDSSEIFPLYVGKTYESISESRVPVADCCSKQEANDNNQNDLAHHSTELEGSQINESGIHHSKLAFSTNHNTELAEKVAIQGEYKSSLSCCKTDLEMQPIVPTDTKASATNTSDTTHFTDTTTDNVQLVHDHKNSKQTDNPELRRDKVATASTRHDDVMAEKSFCSSPSDMAKECSSFDISPDNQKLQQKCQISKPPRKRSKPDNLDPSLHAQLTVEAARTGDIDMKIAEEHDLTCTPILKSRLNCDLATNQSDADTNSLDTPPKAPRRRKDNRQSSVQTTTEKTELVDTIHDVKKHDDNVNLLYNTDKTETGQLDEDNKKCTTHFPSDGVSSCTPKQSEKSETYTNAGTKPFSVMESKSMSPGTSSCAVC